MSLTQRMSEEELPELELIVIAKDAAAKRPLDIFVARLGAKLNRLFSGAPPCKPIDAALDAELDVWMKRFYVVDAARGRLDVVAETLRRHPLVEVVYAKPKAGVPDMSRLGLITDAFELRRMISQPHLGPAPTGVGAAAVVNTPGADGTGINVADVERDWLLDHEDLPLGAHTLVIGTPGGGTDHGTAVAGIIVAQPNGFGVTGIAYRTNMILASTWNAPTTSAIIWAAARHLRAGDVMLIVLDRQGPRDPAWSADQSGRIPLEWWEDDFVAIRRAVNCGIVVVASAGNGAVSLDHTVYDTPQQFSAGWSNPFRRQLDSGAILVGAGYPPPLAVGKPPDRSRTPESNYGSPVDVQGWGRRVATTGYGHVQFGSREQAWYTDRFPMTSAAAPIVAGVVASWQGARKAAGMDLLNSFQVRAALRHPSLCSPQQDGPYGAVTTHRIGGRPDLAKLLALPNNLAEAI